MRSRSLLDHVRVRLGRAGLAASLTVAVTLATVGHQVSSPSASDAAVAPAAAPAPLYATRHSVLRDQPPAPPRAARSAVRKKVKTPTWVRPSRGPLTSGYGHRWGRMHRGIDFGAPYGSPIFAAAAGVVTFSGGMGGYGRLVTIRHKNGWVTAYGHMSRIVVRQGQRVTAGQVVAYVGSAGRSTGPHLHFEVRKGGRYLNPIPFLRARKVGV